MAHLKNLTQLKAAGGVVAREPVKRQVTWDHVSPDGEEMSDTFDVWIVRASIGTQLAIHKEADQDRELVLTVLSKRVQLEDEKGKKISLSYDEWSAFDPALAASIFVAVKEVSDPPKNSQQPTNSYVNSSPVESAVAP